MRGARQDRFLGALMGMGIGDAMGMPVAGRSAAAIAREYGVLDRYLPRALGDGVEIKAGEFTEESELALCIVESATANAGEIDVDNIGARFLFLARGEAKRWIAPETLAALDRAAQTLDFRVPLDEDGPATGEAASRGIPIGLLHAVGTLDEARLREEAEAVTRITHGSPAAIAATTAVAYLVQLAARGDEPAGWAERTGQLIGSGATSAALRADGDEPVGAATSGDEAAAVIATAATAVVEAADFASAVRAAVNLGGASDARGAIAGALAGARWGIAGIPQGLIDGLEGRIYISLAAPWFYRSALRRAGLIIDVSPGRP